MSPDKAKIKNYAEGWITEREGTEIPGFLKIAYPVILFGAIAYFLAYMNGEVNHAERGQLVRALNAATESSAALMYGVVVLILVYGLIVVAFALRRHD